MEVSKTDSAAVTPVIVKAGVATGFEGEYVNEIDAIKQSAKRELRNINTEQEAEERDRGDYVLRRMLIGLTLEKDSYEHVQAVINYFMEGLHVQPNYALVCEHDGPNFPHYHCLFQYPKSVTVHSKKAFFPHFERFVHSAQGYHDYCKGLDAKHQELKINCTVIFEEGTLRNNGGNMRASDIKGMTYTEIRENIDIRLQKMAMEIKNDDVARDKYFSMLDTIRKREKLMKPKVIYTTGASNAGKTYSNFENAVDHYKNEEITTIKFDKNGFAHVDGDAHNCKALIIKEFRDSSMPLDEFLDMTDGYGYRLNVKNGSHFIRPERIYIASVQPVCDLYSDATTRRGWETREQIYRRISICFCNQYADNGYHKYLIPRDEYDEFNYNNCDPEYIALTYKEINEC